MKFRKKPVVIEAMQFNGLDDYLAIVAWMKASGDTHALADEVYYATPEMALQTLEGRMSARPGDWIIQGVKSEFYPCKPDIFAATYEPTECAGCDQPLPIAQYQPAIAQRHPLYQHACGQVQPYEGSEYDGDVMECDGCALPDPWQPLYVLAAPTTGTADKDGAE